MLTRAAPNRAATVRERDLPDSRKAAYRFILLLGAGAVVVGAVAGVIASMHSYRVGFAVLLLPALAALSVLLAARLRYPNPVSSAVEPGPAAGDSLPRRFWIYVAAAGLIAAGFETRVGLRRFQYGLRP